MRDKRYWIRHLSVILASAVLMLALILVVAVCGGMTAPEVPVESDYHFVPSIPQGTFDPSEWFSDFTMPDSLPGTWDFGTWEPNTREPGSDTREPESDTREPSTGRVTAPDWMTLPPEPSTGPEPEWPTLPEDWDTLPDEWDTLPPDWSDVTMPNLGDIGDILAGMDGSLQNPAGALGAGVAAQLTMFKVTSQIDDTVYFKMQSFGMYNGQGWDVAEAYSDLIMDVCSADYLTGLHIDWNDPVLPKYGLSVTPVMAVEVIPYYAIAINGAYGTSDVLASVGLEDAAQRTYLYRHYENVGYGGGPDWAIRFEESYRKYVYDVYCSIRNVEGMGSDLQHETIDYINEIIAREGFYASDPDIINKVAEYVKQAAKYNLNYDKRLDSEENIALAFLGGYREGVCRHFATAATLIYRQLGIPARYTVGFCSNVRGGAQVDVSIPAVGGGSVTEVKGADAHAWVEVYRDGEGWICVEVTPPPEEDTRVELTLTPESVSRVYIPDTPLEPSTVLKGFEQFAKLGYTYDVSIHGARIEPGVNESIIQYIRIFDPDGVDVTDYFNITLKPGRVQVFRAELTFASDSMEQVYNGKSLYVPESGYRLVEGALPDDGLTYRVQIIPTGGQLHVGMSLATFRVEIWQVEMSEDDLIIETDVTDQFRIRRLVGTLTVTPMPITLKLNDREKVYDGTPLEAWNSIEEWPTLAEGDSLVTIEVEGSQTNVGRSESTITNVVIVNGANEDVTRNYHITLLPGNLRVVAE